ncbi:baseplate multidomain protein megatron [Jiella marina]|uniref:baseplate multidomain protein megatron n=1 Tax=Jiella sp. LLJ827 TaxID=2917712 RepID=UPI002100F233|nr:glycoside hydrolase/phage tail family protein [Jiella sp. LLJ827]MCQ0989598.1 glycoside hydrolase/phage tail family protein [Jiella sp. LLJ827]
MATLVLQAAGTVLGSFIGGPFGAVLGRAAGALAGAAIDQSLFGETRRIEGARLESLRIMAAEEGTGIPRIYGTARIAGQVIWTTRFEEEVNTERQGGKSAQPTVEVTTYSYFGNVALGLCEGPIAGIRRIWADGEEMDLTEVNFRVYLGNETQDPDPLIEARQGAGNAPAYRGLAYIVFERLALERYGNRIPQISCEVLRPIGELEGQIRAITVIPGASEHGLDPEVVRERISEGEDALLNRNILHGESDFTASMNELTALCPALKRAALVVAWFGDDLRAGSCRFKPKVEIDDRDETEDWHVGPLGRASAERIAYRDGGPAYGGTPSDQGVLRAIADLKARGLKVTYYPFILMEIGEGNGLPDPYGGTEQAAFPWRGRITLDIAVGAAGSADGTAAARQAIESFLGDATPDDFSWVGGRLFYTGPNEWSYRRMIFHQAHLAAKAGVDAFFIGSEMRGLTRVRDDQGRFPFVEGLIAIAEAVKALMPEGVVSYSADWSEYFGYHPDDGSGDVFFNLDPLWASPAIDVIAIDDYLPLTDWRDGDSDPDAPSIYDRNGLRAGIAGGEYFDWYYPSETDRALRNRAPISDGAHGKPWVFRPKDLVGWWSNPHHERRNGTELATPTTYQPMAKPIWLAELGCPAIDKGANQPNLFVDPKSSESDIPHFSTVGRDDLVQRRFLETHLAYWDPEDEAFDEAANPVSTVYGGRMVDPDAIHVWTWDARPFPAFPTRTGVWSDGDNWRLGHWLSGRLANAPLDRLVAEILGAHEIADIDLTGLEATLGGWVENAPASARDSLESLFRLTGAIAHVTDGTLVARSLARVSPERSLATFVDEADQPLVELRRSEAAETVDAVALNFLDPWRAYQTGSAEATRASVPAPRQEIVSLPAVMDEAAAQSFAASMLSESGIASETASFALQAADLVLEAGDAVTIGDRPGEWLVIRIETGEAHRVTARRIPPRRGGGIDMGAPVVGSNPRPPLASRPFAAFLDLPLPPGGSGAEGARVALSASPFPGYEIDTLADDGTLRQRLRVTRRGTLGRLTAPLGPGPEGRLDRMNALDVALPRGTLSSVSRAHLYAGGNLCAVLCDNGALEVLQFETAEEVALGEYRLRGLLRAQGGTEDAMAAGASPGALFALLDEACLPLGIEAGEVGRALDFVVAPFGRSLDNPASLTLTQALGERSVRPLSPVHLRAAFAEGGSVTLSWIRRTRVGGDNWSARDVPLGEEAERYRVTIGDGGANAVTTESMQAGLVVSADDQMSAFGALPTVLAVSVAQISPVWGAGTARNAIFSRPG